MVNNIINITKKCYLLRIWTDSKYIIFLILLADRLQNGENSGFFSLSVYKEHVKPRLMQLFGVRDGQIRMLLLTHFSKFVHVFSHEELSQHILPEVIIFLTHLLIKWL